MKAKQKAIERIEKGLLTALLDYLVPFLDKKIKPKAAEKANNLENIVLNSKPKIGLSDMRKIEDLLLENIDGSTKTGKIFGANSRNVLYSLNLTRKKEISKPRNYSIEMQYEEDGKGDKLKIEVKKDGKELYSVETKSKKDREDSVTPYKFTVSYEDKYGEERLAISYNQQLRNYMKKHINEKEDMANRVPLKWLNILPESMMGGVLGFTYIGDPAMGRRADLTGWTARMVDIHESIHTPDEYETRVLTSWIMEKAKGKYVN